MKNRIIEYIKKQSLDFCEYQEGKIYIDYSYNPVSASILESLIKKHFTIKVRYAFLGSMVAMYI